MQRKNLAKRGSSEERKLYTLSNYCTFLLIVLGLNVFISRRSWAHDVGEPQLEKLQIWQRCCGEGDCVSQQMRITGTTASSVEVEIDGIPTSVNKEKFSPVPSDHTWVCYFQPNGKIENENIRCILYPQEKGTT